MTQHLGGRDRISINSVSQGHMLQNPILKKNQTNINNKNRKIRGESKQASGATCGLGLALYLKSQREQGDVPVKGCLSIAVSPPHLLGKELWSLAFCLLIPVIPSHATETTKNQLELH